MLAYTLFVFSAKTLNCCDLMLLLLVLEFMRESMCIRRTGILELDDSDDCVKWDWVGFVGSVTMVFQVVVASVELERVA